MKRPISLLMTLPRRVSHRSFAGLAVALLCAAALSACVGEEGIPRDETAMLPEDQRVSSVPWNKPQGWENTSQLGALANDPRIGGGGVTGANASSNY